MKKFLIEGACWEMLKKLLNGIMIFFIAGIFAGCSDNSSEPQPTKPTKTEKVKTETTASTKRLYGEDLQITQDEFVSVYNDVINQLAQSSGKNYDNLKINLDDTSSIEQSPNGATHFYFGERGFISVFRNTKESSTICAAMLTAKANYKLSDMSVEIEALTQATTQKQNDFQNVMNFLKSAIYSQSSSATNIDGLVVSYNNVGNYLTLITEDSKAGNGFERMVDNVIDSAKMGSYWQK